MSFLRLVILTIATAASCKASGLHFAPAVKSFPVVRYAPFYNFPTGARSIHAVAPFAAAGPAPLLPAPLAAPVLPAPPIPAPVLPAPALPAPAFPTSVLPAPLVPAPTFPAFHAAQAPPFAPAFAAPVASLLPKLAPVLPSLPALHSPIPALPAFHSAVPALPALAPAPVFARALPSFSPAPFAPIVRPVVAPAPAAPLFAPASIPVAKTIISPYSYGHLHGRFLSPAPLTPTPFANQIAWK